jgi:hypothetical protein
MSNKRDPTEPSYFVSSVLRPIKNFFAIGVAEGPGYLLREHFMETYATEVFDNVTQRQVLGFLVDRFYSRLIGHVLDTSATSRP